MPLHTLMVSLFLLFSLAAAAASSEASRVFDVRSYGAVPDGKTDSTAAVRAAAAAAADFASPGNLATLSFCCGTYITGPFNLTSFLILHVEENATVLGSTVASEWRVVEAARVWPQFGTGSDCERGSSACRLMHQAFLFAWNVTNLTLSGKGTIDANGQQFWSCAHALQNPPCSGHARPHLLMISNASDVTMRDLTIKNSPDWTLHFSSVRRLLVDNVRVINPQSAPNSDGIDLDCVSDAIVQNSYFDVGDDAICVKSGFDFFGRQFHTPSRNIIFRNIIVGHGHGISVGSEESGGVHNVLFENITMTGTLRGPRIKAERGRGGTVSNITFRDVKAANVTTGISVNMEYQQGIPPTNATATPVFQNFVFERISFTGRGTAGEFIGLPESPLINLSLVDVTFPQDAAFGECKHVIGSYCTGTTNRCPPCFESKY